MFLETKEIFLNISSFKRLENQSKLKLLTIYNNHYNKHKNYHYKGLMQFDEINKANYSIIRILIK